MLQYSYSNQRRCKKFTIICKQEIFQFHTPKTKTEINLKSLTLHVTTRQIVQIGLGLDFFDIAYTKKKF
jgi:hypothetical protein